MNAKTAEAFQALMFAVQGLPLPTAYPDNVVARAQALSDAYEAELMERWGEMQDEFAAGHVRDMQEVEDCHQDLADLELERQRTAARAESAERALAEAREEIVKAESHYRLDYTDLNLRYAQSQLALTEERNRTACEWDECIDALQADLTSARASAAALRLALQREYLSYITNDASEPLPLHIVSGWPKDSPAGELRDLLATPNPGQPLLAALLEAEKALEGPDDCFEHADNCCIRWCDKCQAGVAKRCTRAAALATIRALGLSDE